MSEFIQKLSSRALNIVKNISSELIRECHKKGVTLSPEFASMGVCLLCWDPEYGLSLDDANDADVVKDFVQFCTNKFRDEHSPCVKMLKMQHHYLNNPIDPERVLHKYQANIDTKTQPIYKEIMGVENPNKEELEKLFRKIMIYINMTYLLGSPTNAKVLAETSHALKSVISQADLADFFVLNKSARAKQLEEIQEIVCGIRVFNKDAGHCGEGIRDIQSDLELAYGNTKNALTERLDSIGTHISKLANTLNSLFDIDNANDQIKIHLSPHITEENFNYLKDMLKLSLQHESYVKSLIKLLSQLKTDIDRKLEEFRKLLNTIHEIVQYRTAVSTDKVFPHFARVSILWQSLLNCIYILVEVNKMNEYLSTMCDVRLCEALIKKIDDIWVVKKPQKDTSAQIQAISHELMKSNLPFIPSNSQVANQFISTISKFCPYIFTIGDGILVPSKTVAGYVKFENTLLSFSSAENAKSFLSHPEENFNKLIITMRRHPEVVTFFDIYDMVSEYNIHDKDLMKKEQSEPPEESQNDRGIQTELHPIPYYKDPTYTWNIWDLRKKAIKLANLKKCKTHSAQTEVSFNRMSAGLQTISVKDNSCQTTCDAYTNICKKDASTDCSSDNVYVQWRDVQ